jgi:hypothetical protein
MYFHPDRRIEIFPPRLTAEIHHGRLLASWSALEILLLGKSEETGNQVGRK